MKKISYSLSLFVIVWQSTFSQAWINYSAADKSFAFSYPKSWEIVENKGIAKVMVFQRNKSYRDVNDVDVSVMITPITATDSVGNFKSNIQKNIAAIKQSEIIQIEDRNYVDYPGVYVDFVSEKHKSSAGHQILRSIMKNGHFITIRYNARLSMDKEFINDGLRMINSFQITVGQDEAADSIEGSARLFADVDTKLTIQEKTSIYRLLNFKLAKDKALFIQNNDTNAEYPFEVKLSTVDLNADGVDEVIVTWGNNYTSGMAGHSVALFIKGSSGYQKNLDFSGDILDILASNNNGFPDLTMDVPGLEIPIWKYNGHTYVYFKSIPHAEYDQLKRVRFEDFKRNPKQPMEASKPIPSGSAPAKIPPTKSTTTSNPLAKKFILQRWITQDIIGSGHAAFNEMKRNNETSEIEFTKEGKCYFYKNGLLQEAVPFVLAPDGRSLLLTAPNGEKSMPLEIISITSNKLSIKGEMFQGGTAIFTAK